VQKAVDAGNFDGAVETVNPVMTALCLEFSFSANKRIGGDPES
jgi:hypothetical protein